jgi:hypothetical protein
MSVAIISLYCCSHISTANRASRIASSLESLAIKGEVVVPVLVDVDFTVRWPVVTICPAIHMLIIHNYVIAD